MERTSVEVGWSSIFSCVGSLFFAGCILVYLQAILVPFVLAVFLAYLVRPLAEWISAHLCLCRRRSRASRRNELLKRAAGPSHNPEEQESLLPKTVGSPSGLDLPGALNVGGQMIEEATEQLSTGLPRWVGVLLAMALAVSLLGSVVVLMASSVSSLGSRLDAYQQRAHDLWAIAIFHLRPLGLELADEFIFPSKAVSAHLVRATASHIDRRGARAWDVVAPGHPSEVRRRSRRGARSSRSPRCLRACVRACVWRACAVQGSALNAGLGLLNDFILVLIFLVFILLEPTSARSPLRRRIDDSVSRYLVLKSLICLSLAVFTFVVLSVLRFPLALFLAIVTYILSFIPNLGPMVAVGLPLPICLLDTSVPAPAAALAIVLPALAHVLVGNLLEPQLFGKQFRMSPVVILFSLGVWWILWGIIGAMLAVPLTSILRLISSEPAMQSGEGGYYIVVLNNLLEGRPLDSVTSGQQAATPRRAQAAEAAADEIKEV